MSDPRKNIKPGMPYFNHHCTNCNEEFYGAAPELIHAHWPDGSVDQHSACAKCVILINGHNARVDAEAAASKPPDTNVGEVMERMQPPPRAIAPERPAPPQPASTEADVGIRSSLQAIAVALTSLADGQQAIIDRLPEPEPPPAKKSHAKRTTTRRR